MKINWPSLVEGNFGSDRESFDNCDGFDGERISIVGFLGFIISHLTWTLNRIILNKKIQSFLVNLLGASLSGSSLAIDITFPKSSSSSSR